MRFNPSLKLATHKEFASYLLGNQVPPINVEISPTGRCQANCEWCFYSGQRDTAELEVSVLLDLMLGLEEIGTKAISWTGGGEPTMHHEFERLTEMTLLKQGLFTNGLKVAYNPALFDWIRVSKTNMPWDVEKMRKLRECKTLGLCVNYTGDEEAVREAIDVAEDVGANYVQVRPALRRGGLPTILYPPIIKHPKLVISDYKFEEARKGKTYSSCEGFHFVPFVWQNGDVSACAYHKGDDRYKLGNLYEKGIKEILERAPRSLPVIDSCQTCCKNHEINMEIDEAKGLEDRDFV